MSTTILAIETSCDDTSASVISDDIIKSNIVSSQLDHSKLGGVVPEIASRKHQKNITYIVNRALIESSTKLSMLNAIACTNGPGLLGSLLVGTSFAKSISYSLGIPLICVDHIKAHALSHTINTSKLDFPFISLVVSGGHTQIMYIESYDNIKILGETRDDAVGEAFDKCGKIMGLDYPAGPLIDVLSKDGDSFKFNFPNTKVPGMDFSFSGIKTSFLYFINDNLNANKNFITENLNDIASSIQYKLVEMVIDKLKIALKEYKVSNIAVGGGVAANSLLRNRLMKLENEMNIKVNISDIEYCTDNAAMIANYSRFMYKDKKFSRYDSVPFSKN